MLVWAGEILRVAQVMVDVEGNKGERAPRGLLEAPSVF